MTQKKILRPDRLRQVPAQFSWIDQRLVRDNFLRRAEPAAWALYLVLVIVADAQGLSYLENKLGGNRTDAFVQIRVKWNIPAGLERSRSGRGGHSATDGRPKTGMPWSSHRKGLT